MHQCDEEDEDFPEEVVKLNQAWGLAKFQASSESSPSSTLSKRIFVPINDQFNQSRTVFTRPGGGSHWSLLLWTIILDPHKLPTSTFYHFDSSSGYNASAAASVARKLLKVLHSHPNDATIVADVTECKTPQQNNGYDCGLCLLGFAEALLNQDPSLSQERYEAALEEYASGEKGETFASILRKQISQAIRELMS
jgi:Ulp1 family protease